MMKPGRNHPCPCGSGIKYKKCCLLRSAPSLGASPPSVSPARGKPADEGLDDLSNSVLDLVQARRFPEALAVCQHLLLRFPDVVDGLERSALVHAARGDHSTAADFYRKALAFVTDPSRCHEYEDADWYRQQLAEQEHLAHVTASP